MPLPNSDYFRTYQHSLSSAFGATEFTAKGEGALASAAGLDRWKALTDTTARSGGIIYFIGNGASASMASHMALDATKNAGMRSMAFNDPAFLTAISNDVDYASVFALPLSAFASSKDLLIAISSSGNSKNIVEALLTAEGIGMHAVTLTGMSADNAARELGDLNIYCPALTYGIVECCHQALLHCWLDRMMGIEPK